MRVRMAFISNTKYLLMAEEGASKYRPALPLPTEQAERVVRDLLPWWLTFGVPNVIRCDGGGEARLQLIMAEDCDSVGTSVLFSSTGNRKKTGRFHEGSGVGSVFRLVWRWK